MARRPPTNVIVKHRHPPPTIGLSLGVATAPRRQGAESAEIAHQQPATLTRDTKYRTFLSQLAGANLAFCQLPLIRLPLSASLLPFLSNRAFVNM
ncbi:unnamed protein product, partial [Mesorhabditis belari]|uniref:Uncharacterized protein n=1 Tax=Mesorhabditis belari TaxID=2138241 RepID=A0AAF3FGS0_9BILA